MPAIQITKENFASEVMGSSKAVLLDFWADWCGPCRMVSPIVDEISDERNDIKVGKINVDENMTIAQKYRVASIPNFVIFRDGQPVANFVGAMSEADFREKLEQVIL